jgi:toxin-antitoxin system PIN domain toxin
VIAVDTNILIYGHREDSPFHETAARRLSELAEGGSEWAIPWPCVHEFLAIVTHPRIYDPPTPLSLALDQIDAWLESPTLVLLGESDQHWSTLRRFVTDGKVTGPRVHDARVAAICNQYNVKEFWSADRDFSRFPEVTVVNPLTK